MRTLLVIGIGAGDLEYVTIQAIKAMNRVDTFFVIDKGGDKHELVALRQQICDRYITDHPYRWVSVQDPQRDRKAVAYRPAVEDWRRRRADIFEALIRDELGEDGCGGFLVWGDPSLYDSTLAIIDDLVARGTLDLVVEVIPGISSIQALAAKHHLSLNRVGRPVHVTTGRLLAEGFPEDCEDVVVMLDAECSFNKLSDEIRAELDIFWGAYVGTDDEILVAGRLDVVGDEIVELRGAARTAKGWIMDTYMLRRRRR